MISQRLYFAQFKNIPPKQVSPYKDPFRKLHAENVKAHKKQSKIERRMERMDDLKRTAHDMRETREAREYSNHRHRLLNVI